MAKTFKLSLLSYTLYLLNFICSGQLGEGVVAIFGINCEILLIHCFNVYSTLKLQLQTHIELFFFVCLDLYVGLSFSKPFSSPFVVN